MFLPRQPSDELPTLTSVGEYQGESAIRVEATQLDHAGYTASQQRRIVDDWVDFLSAGSSPIIDLRFVSRTPKRLFAALRAQTQLRRLEVKWGDYDTLDALGGMTELQALILGGASSLRSVAALTTLQSVTVLSLGSIRLVTDLSAIGDMGGVVNLEIGGDLNSPRNGHIESIGFLSRMPQLRALVIHTVIVDDLDYTPILHLPALESVRVKKVRGMRPPFEELRAATPWSGP